MPDPTPSLKEFSWFLAVFLGETEAQVELESPQAPEGLLEFPDTL